MMPRAKIVSLRMLLPANRSKSPKIDPDAEFRNCCHCVTFTPGVGIWLPSRYTASSPSVNSNRLRRSGTRKMLANASKNLFMVPSLRRGKLRSRRSADNLRAFARLLDLLHGRFRKLVRLHRDLARQLTRAQHLQAVMHLPDDARRQER